ncbi:MAG: hypothetical protein ACRD3A_14810 [Terriglobales bacterium]
MPVNPTVATPSDPSHDFLRSAHRPLIARDEKLERVTGNILPENREMQGLAKKVGFQIKMDPGHTLYTAMLPL